MNIWIVTIGSSDVQLDSDTENRKKGRKEEQRSDKIWRYWYEDEVEEECHDIEFAPKQAYKDKDEPYRIEPRVLGMVYESSTQDVQKEIWSYLTFPLLDNFVGQLKEKSPPDAIAVLLTNQSEIFQTNQKRRKPKCAYWQDTCTLKGILSKYFQDRFSHLNAESIEWIPLAPNSPKKGLDNWDYVLDLVDEKLRNLHINGEAINVNDVETAYVSHQAGTPAISSAVQFASLAQFKKVEFLVSNEYDSSLTEFVPDSKYLQKLQREKAKELLDRHDYSGVKALLESYLSPEIKILLEAAIQWNFAKFDEFINQLESYPKFAEDVQKRKQPTNWWWTAYEAAYLGVVRLKQGNTVEAMFHSFRAFEGLAIKDAERHKISGKFGRKAFKSLRHRKQAEWNRHPYIKTLIDLDTTDQEQRNDLLDKRNNLFHQLQGFQKNDLFNAWASDESHWQEKALGCLNFVSGETFEFLDKEESDGTVASLMVKVHQKLENAIAHLQY